MSLVLAGLLTEGQPAVRSRAELKRVSHAQGCDNIPNRKHQTSHLWNRALRALLGSKSSWFTTKTTFFVSGNFYRRFVFFSLRIHSQLWRFCHLTAAATCRLHSENGPRCSCWQPPWRRRLLNLLDLCCSSEFSVILMAIIHIIPSVIKRGKSCVCYCKNLELKRKKFCLLMQIRQET